MRSICFLFAASFFIFLSCSSEDDLPGSAPVANAGQDEEVPICVGTIVLDGSQSSDADSDTLSYAWTITSAPSGSSATLNNDDEARASITPDVVGTYEITLSVSDGVHPAVTDQVFLTITEDTGNPPTAVAGEDRTVSVNEAVTLDGSGSTDPDGDTLSYQWSLSSKPVGSQATITNANEAQAQFTPDTAGTYRFRLKVTDAAGSCQSEDTVELVITAE